MKTPHITCDNCGTEHMQSEPCPMCDALPTVDELNAIQAEWMKLDPHAPKAECQRVFKLLERYPKRYVSGHDGRGVCMCDGTPMSVPIAFSDALEQCKRHHGRTDVAWNGQKGEWYAL